ncbi:hypothetical protein HDU97_003935 [Phlyctochytrium planicorne]|nr:hypothetical protein HDU97_003935 [Phlyctochytrium planicorne]
MSGSEIARIRELAHICIGPASGFKQPRLLTSPDKQTQGYVAVDPTQQTIFFGFQGAVNQGNWVNSFEFPRTKYDVPGADPKASVHAGFFGDYKNFRPVILSEIKATVAANPSFKIHAIGHSYVCTLATFTVADLLLTHSVTNPSNVEMSLFGCPRIGNYEFSRMMDQTLRIGKIRRVVHSYDIIPHFPPTALGYRHFGEEIWLDMDKKKFSDCTDVASGLDESGSCSNSVPLTAWSINPHNSYFDRKFQSACSPLTIVNGKPLVSVRYMPFEVLTTRD